MVVLLTTVPVASAARGGPAPASGDIENPWDGASCGVRIPPRVVGSFDEDAVLERGAGSD